MNRLSTLNSFRLWQKERFPAINLISGFFVYLLAKAICILDPEISLKWELIDIVLMFVPALHLFILRVLDEHKDFESDQLHYPNRVIQRGLFKLSQVRNCGIVAFCLQAIILITFFSISSLFTYFILWLWTWLMYKEFFIKEWLKSHFLIYGLSHLIITPVLFLLCLVLSSERIFYFKSWIVALALALMTGWLYELTRKTKAPAEETGDTSYSKIWGIRKSLIINIVSICVTHFIIFNLFKSLFIPSYIFYIGLLSLIPLAILTLLNFYRNPTVIHRKKNEGVVALATLYAYIVPLVWTFFK